MKTTEFILSIGTPYLLTILVLKFEIVHSTTSCCVSNIALSMANSVDPDQTPHSVASDLGLYFCKSLSVPILKVIIVTGRRKPVWPRKLNTAAVFSFVCPLLLRVNFFLESNSDRLITLNTLVNGKSAYFISI